VVPHRGTSWAVLWLIAQIGRDAMLSKSYGRGCLRSTISVLVLSRKPLKVCRRQVSANAFETVSARRSRQTSKEGHQSVIVPAQPWTDTPTSPFLCYQSNRSRWPNAHVGS
jgi:hypothetical protein